MELHVIVSLYYNEKSYAEKNGNLKIIENDSVFPQYKKYIENFLKKYRSSNKNLKIISLHLKFEDCANKTNILEDYFNVLFLLNNYDEIFNGIDIDVIDEKDFVNIFFLYSSGITAFDILVYKNCFLKNILRNKSFRENFQFLLISMMKKQYKKLQ